MRHVLTDVWTIRISPDRTELEPVLQQTDYRSTHPAAMLQRQQ